MNKTFFGIFLIAIIFFPITKTNAEGEAVKESINSSLNFIENFRIDTANKITAKIIVVQSKIDSINSSNTKKIPATPKIETDNISRPFLYAELTVLKFGAFVFGNKVAFYLIGLVVILYMLNSIRRLFV